MTNNDPTSRPRRAYLGAIAFLLAFFLLLLLVSNRFLIPALRISNDIDPTGRKHLAAIASLVLTIVLFSLFVLLFMVFRPGRFFLARKTEPRTKTDYIDAWQESADRMPMPNDDETDPDSDPAK
jgi:hypothetical protein